MDMLLIQPPLLEKAFFVFKLATSTQGSSGQRCLG